MNCLRTGVNEGAQSEAHRYGACTRVGQPRSLICRKFFGVEDSRVRVDPPYAEVPGECELSVTCDSAEDREWIDELLRRAGSTGTWVT